ncbi:MAG: FKBP-type peptidyl-prolyl cis-trans isomerase [Actinomycetota bacterium]
MIPGWQQGIPGMREGGRRLLRIPPDLAYGQSGGPGIPPNEPLIFVIDLVKA